jgi:dTDP-3-amino-3,4,6-trideoxy-alpha-D-glucopyranose N,N-dimethyltransferase
VFTQTARYYDLIYSFKDYGAESAKVLSIARANLRSDRLRLLDVACGTGRHLEFLKEHFEVEGLDLAEDLLELATARNPGVPFHRADMTSFELGRRFDVVICLFSSIGYVKTLDGLNQAVACMTHHLAPGGLLIVEPWFTPAAWHPNTVHAELVDQPELKIARVNTSFVAGRLSYFDLHYLIGTPQSTEHFVERHELGLFEVEEMQASFHAAGLQASYDPEGLTGRGLHLGIHP